jgi:hypothetical protein
MTESAPRGQVWQLGRVVDWLHDKLVEPYLNEHDGFLQRLRKIMTIVTSHVVPGLVVVSIYLSFVSLTYGPPEHWTWPANNRSGNETAGSRSFGDSYFATSVAWAVMVVIFPVLTLTCNVAVLLMFYCGAKRDGAAADSSKKPIYRPEPERSGP